MASKSTASKSTPLSFFRSFSRKQKKIVNVAVIGGPGVGKSKVLKVIDYQMDEIFSKIPVEDKCRHVKMAYAHVENKVGLVFFSKFYRYLPNWPSLPAPRTFKTDFTPI